MTAMSELMVCTLEQIAAAVVWLIGLGCDKL